MAQGELWATLLTAINPINASAMPVALQSTIDLLETELAKARAALQQIQAAPQAIVAEDVTAGAMEAYKVHLVGSASSRTQSSHTFLPLIDESFVRYSTTAGPKASRQRTTLSDLLLNSLVIEHLAPYMSVASLLSLASTNKTMRSLIMDTPYVFRHLNLVPCRGAQASPSRAANHRAGDAWTNGETNDSMTEDKFYSQALRGIFDDLGRRSVLQDVRTLVLDGLSVPADLVAEILLNERFNVTILSIRGCLHLNERKLMQALQFAVRPGRAKGMPRVKGVYHFSAKDSDAQPRPDQPPISLRGQHDDLQRRHEWYRASGQVLSGPVCSEWAQTLQLCERIISFDAVLCRGPRHHPESYMGDHPKQIGSYLPPAIATVALGPRGCEGCGTTPEGPAVWGYSPDECFPLLSPPPLHSSRVSVAKNPAVHKNESPTLIMQCEDCIRNRCCRRCRRWWCSDCLQDPEMIRQPDTAYQPPGMFAGMGHVKGHQLKVFNGLCIICRNCHVDP
ncbi:hypothetical protein LOZ58_005814 [Ophidiomyces ophidiicola]|nr:hypothetical protein LOZ58_005814 [Ophidiomyces ophidiicola]